MGTSFLKTSNFRAPHLQSIIVDTNQALFGIGNSTTIYVGNASATAVEEHCSRKKATTKNIPSQSIIRKAIASNSGLAENVPNEIAVFNYRLAGKILSMYSIITDRKSVV